MPLFREPLFCEACHHHVSQHKKYDKSGGLDERCEKIGYYWSLSLQSFVKGICPCKGYVPPKIDRSQLRCIVCHKSINQHHEINKTGQRRCQFCGTLFGDEWAHFDLQKEMRK